MYHKKTIWAIFFLGFCSIYAQPNTIDSIMPMLPPVVRLTISNIEELLRNPDLEWSGLHTEDLQKLLNLQKYNHNKVVCKIVIDYLKKTLKQYQAYQKFIEALNALTNE